MFKLNLSPKANKNGNRVIRVSNPFAGIKCGPQASAQVLGILLRNEYKALRKIHMSGHINEGIISESLKFENLDDEKEGD